MIDQVDSYVIAMTATTRPSGFRSPFSSTFIFLYFAVYFLYYKLKKVELYVYVYCLYI